MHIEGGCHCGQLKYEAEINPDDVRICHCTDCQTLTGSVYRVTVAARRTLHLRLNDLDDPQPIPRDTDYASVFESDVPIIVQHTRLDSRRAEVALLSTVAYAEG